MLIINLFHIILNNPLSRPAKREALLSAGGVEKVYLTAKNAKEYAKHTKTNH